MSDRERNDVGVTQLGQIAARAIKLYSRPSVAMEIVRLTEQPHVDAQRLRECIEQDPALACKILRVVNSSLFGLPGRVGDLDQALSLLGIKPLKLLVLGFSLPDNLFAEVAARELRWYWTNTLTRAVAARLLSEQLWHQPGDEAFIGGLLEDLGTLVMLRELGRPYAKFLTGVIDEHCDLGALERSTLGFDHRELTALLLARWQLPQKLVDAIAAPRDADYLAQQNSAQGELAQVLHLASLLCQLVGQRRLRVLPELLAAGREYRELTAARLTELVRQLQPQVDQLAEALALELDTNRDYSQILREAHEQMGILSEEVVAGGGSNEHETDAYARLRVETSNLSTAMQSFLSKAGGDDASARRSAAAPLVADDAKHPKEIATPLGHFQSNKTLVRKLSATVTRCRQNRHALSLLVLEARGQGPVNARHDEEIDRLLCKALDRACQTFESENVSLVSLGNRRAAAVLTNCDRSAALAVGQYAIRHMAAPGDASKHIAVAQDVTVSVGVATASAVPKNFDLARLIDSAERCLFAARTCGISTVKSIEV